MKPFLLFSLVLPAVLAGCVAAPPGPPEEVAPKIIALLDAGKTDEAAELFEAAADQEGARDQLYPLLYEQARSRYERGEARSSAGILRLMAREYPKSRAVSEALVYALFVERAGVEQPTGEMVQELGSAIARLREGGVETPPWVELVQAQQAIDRGELGAAREAFARFQRTRTESTAELTVYTEDIERYLRSHP